MPSGGGGGGGVGRGVEQTSAYTGLHYIIVIVIYQVLCSKDKLWSKC